MGYIIAVIDLVVGLLVAGMGIYAYGKLRGGVLSWSVLFLAVTGILYVVHAAVEVFEFGEVLYAVTALIATIALGLTLVICDKTLKLLEGK